MHEIKMILFDIDGVITDGKKYTDGNNLEYKTIALKDLDALGELKAAGYKIGCVTGEDNSFSDQFRHMKVLDYVKQGCKNKEQALKEIEEEYSIEASEICYVGDGKYDIPVLKKVGLALCPKDSIHEVKQFADIVLKKKGGEGCIAEIYTLLSGAGGRKQSGPGENTRRAFFIEKFAEHRQVLDLVLKGNVYTENADRAANMIIESYRNKGALFLCGNGGSAADAQHLAAELVGRFYLERKAFNAEALTVNTSVLTSLANDYDYHMIFARQLEAKAKEGDVLIGITTSGTSENIIKAFQKAKKMQIRTILMTGNIQKYSPILSYTYCLLAIPSDDVPRIQEMHILTGHIICEIVERELKDL